MQSTEEDRPQGLKPASIRSTYAAPSTSSGQALEGPLFHGDAGLCDVAESSGVIRFRGDSVRRGFDCGKDY